MTFTQTSTTIGLAKYLNEYLHNTFDTFIIVLIRVLVNMNTERGGKLNNLSKFTDFGLRVKTELLRTGKDQKWLEEVVTEKTGLFVDNGYMYKILTGQRNAPKIVTAISEILNIKVKE